MSTTDTNEFVILNLKELETKYRLLKIVGLQKDPQGNPQKDRGQNDYYQNCQNLIKKLSFKLKQPVTIIERENEDNETVPYLVVPEKAQVPFSHMVSGGKPVVFEPSSEVLTLDYTKRSPENDKICLRFLEFLIQAPLYSHPELWQPKAGAPYFRRRAENPDGHIAHYIGFRVRPVITSEGTIALRVHIANKYISRDPLPANITRQEFNRMKKNHFIYHYGYQWYEVSGLSFNDFKASQYPVKINDHRRQISLLEYVVEESKKPIPPELAKIQPNAAVLTYLNNSNQDRAVISSLCYRVYGPQDREAKGLHKQSILPPHRRRQLAIEFANRYLTRLSFGKAQIEIDTDPISVPTKSFSIPDLKFGNNQILSVRGTKGALHTTLEELGADRVSLLKSKKAGFYNTAPLGRQYFIIPESVNQSWGEILLKMLNDEVDDFMLQENGYQPKTVAYNDFTERTFLEQSKSIIRAVQEQCDKPGHALVMIHHIARAADRDEDTLAAMVVKELRERFDISAAVIHTKIGEDSFILGKNDKGDPVYRVDSPKRGKLAGYVQKVALNKILLLNERCPFILSDKMHADLVIGIDVKNNTASFILVDGYGENVRFLPKSSRQKEKLRDDQTESYIYEIVYAESKAQNSGNWKNVVIQRDGRLWDSERIGIKRAFERLKRDNILPKDASLTLLEIPKSAIAPFRLFTLIEKKEFTQVINPQIGQYEIRGDEGHICTTGRAFRRAGTSLPLHVRKIEGAMPFEQCLEDVFCLSNLAWTNPVDCLREPITVRLNDRVLSDEATKYDAEGLEYALSIDDETDEGGEEAA